MSRAVPELRFPGFEGEWDDCALEDIAEVERGRFSARPRNDPRYFGGSIPFVQTGDVARSERNLAGFSQTLNESGLAVSKIFPAGTIIITIAANIGDVCIAGFPVAFPDSLVGISVRHGFYRDFLYSYLETRKEELLSYATQNAQANINLQVLNPLRIPAPLLAEQQKIADFLGTVDARLEALRRKKSGLEAFKSGLMQRLFSQTLRFTRDDGTDFPDWAKMRLGEVFRERSERGRAEAELLSVTMDRGVVRAVDIGREDGASADTSNYKFVAVNDLAYNSMRMWQGASGISGYDGIVSPAYTVITPRTGQFPRYWAYRFKAHDLIFKFRQFSQGLTSDTWNLKFPALSAISVEVPHPDEQRKIADALSVLDAKIAAVAEQITRMEAFKKGLLQQMFI